MTTQKRSKSINLRRMRKHFAIKPLALGVTSVFLAACTDNRQEASVYQTVDECINDNPAAAEQCQSAYEKALIEAERTGLKYGNRYDCENEFGANQCREMHANNGGSFFMPFMAGYMISNLLSPRGYYSQPMYTSYSRYSPLRGRWMTADGYDFGDTRRRHMKVGQNTYKPKPTVNRTIKRGGFGSSVRAKSSWGKSSSRKSGWGG